MLVATGLASAAVERRKAGAPPPNLPRKRGGERDKGHAAAPDGAELGWMAPIGAPPPFLFGGKRFVALIRMTRMQTHRGNEITCRHCRACPGNLA